MKQRNKSFNAPFKALPQKLSRRSFLTLTAAGMALQLLSIKASANQSSQTTAVDQTTLPQDHRFWYGDDKHQFGDWRKPEGAGPFPLLVFIHGGYWRNAYNLEYAEPLCEALRAQGIATWNLEYRRIGDKGGAYPGTFLDIANAIDFIRSDNFAKETGHCVDLNNVVVMGHSAGGHLAVWAASRYKIPKEDTLWIEDPFKFKGVISLAGLHSLEYASTHRLSNNIVKKLMHGSAKERPEAYYYASPINMAPIDVPITLIHGTNDNHVPIELSTDYLAAAKGGLVNYIEIENADHFDIVKPDSFCGDLIIAAVKSSLA